ncbi:carbamoyltransferase HypF [Poseidonibacter ostreae]|jgi:hydrogenase maturation protein HypF|uniref:Carbamoyltransferase n=1 Tax=Poseidonibacter ostreae TaxID=2654171 RepID=A0A6L4WRC8_9BACT|nr:carbamoyltransferase HypF [Poseidonibacter ostreae]KAB7884194.1 carbamoyltransferase HypF [Poseidonibacter ostreae]KAB7888100.1 carbamoyltransferase HypF [Poseidonibacter ostreae]KAB7891715.1 carbamoyltransferase HypF [Poseidonibacter ostreae]
MLTFKVKIKGIVQGVGFRPFVYNLALKYKINGWVNNDDRGVNILLYSSSKNCDLFLKELEENPPVLSKINSIEIKEITSSKIYENFEIIQSQTSNKKSTIISSDIAICDDCIDDINDKSNHRYNYALTNCTNCGPRYSIIKTVPYDRVNTSMKEFDLCPTCKKEYEDPTNRRYHAQPVSCSKCGPNVSLYNNKNEKLARDIEAIKSIAKYINNGAIVAIKGIGGFHLICDAKNTKTVEELRIRKSRPSKPLAVMFKNIQSIKEYTNITKKEEEFLNSKEKPIVLVKRKENTSLSHFVAPDISRLGCFIAYTPLHNILFRYLDNPIIATSANLKDEPIIRFKDEIIEKLPLVVEYILDFNRDIINSCDDSVIQVVNNDILSLRNARAYAPTALKLEKSFDKKILALGANQKSTISIAFENNLILSPHIADLNSIESIEYFKRTIQTFKDFYDFEPDVIICDKHPNYESTKFAKTFETKTIVQIQHHYAHILSCMAEYNLKKEVIGFAFDGTGYGDDKNIWGGEVFVCDNKKYKRVKHLKYFKLLGGEVSVKEPKRVALSLLFDIYSLDEIKTLDLECVKAFKASEISMLYTMWQKGLNSPLTSSIGRLFDAVASLADICQIQSYEGETGLLIEQEYDSSIKDSYSYNINDEEIDISSMIKEIVKDKNKTLICSKFINTLVNIILEISSSYKDLPLVLSGGVFQNKTLFELLISKLDSLNKEYYYSKNIPLNDGGISVGQIYSQL